MNKMIIIPLYLLHLSLFKRISIVVFLSSICLVIYSSTFPSTTWGGLFLIPVACAGWFFGITVGLLWMLFCFLLFCACHGSFYGFTLWSGPRIIPMLIGAFVSVICVILMGGLRVVTNKLCDVQRRLRSIQEAYEQEHKLNQIKDTTILVLSHEVRNPLTQVQGFLDLLEESQTQATTSDQAYFLLQAKQGCDELLQLLTTMLDTVPSAGKRGKYRGELFLQREISTLLALLDPREIARYDIQIDVPETIQVRGDRQCLMQILHNLLSNVFKYVPEDTQVVIRAIPFMQEHEQQGQAEKICVQVCDQGPGIAPEQQALIFERFIRLQSDIHVWRPGAGLGLFICKQLVESMGGTIWVESTGRAGDGCCFSFLLERVGHV